jgi:hypothetical protein
MQRERISGERRQVRLEGGAQLAANSEGDPDESRVAGDTISVGWLPHNCRVFSIADHSGEALQ